MNFDSITSKSNDKIKRVGLLIRSASARREGGAFVIEGLRLCHDAVLNNIVIDELYFTEDAYKKHQDIMQVIIDSSNKRYCVSNDVITKISDTNNSQGVVAVVGFKNILTAGDINPNGRYIACENVADPSNLGAIARTAEALGLSGLMLIDHCCDAYNPKALRASMGALLRLPVYTYADTNEFCNMCKCNNMRSVASVVHSDATDIKEFVFNNGDIVVIGNEANGMSDALINMCDERINIRIKGRAESFNAAVAASIIMWELSAK